MLNSTSHAIRLVLLFGTMVSLGCGSTRVVTKTKLPARIKAMQSKQRVKVSAFGGRYGDSARRELRTAIIKSRFHTLVESGADTIISGNVLEGDYTTKVTRSKTRRCVARTKKSKCTKRVTIWNYRRREQCSGKIALSVKSAHGQVIYEGIVDGTASDTVDREGSEPPMRFAEVCKDAHKQARELLGHFVSPHEIWISLKFKDVDDGGVTEEAVKLAEQSAFRGAVKILVNQVDRQKNPELRAWTHYNLATVLSAMGEFRQCTDELSQARVLLGTDPDVIRLLNHCKGYTL